MFSKAAQRKCLAFQHVLLLLELDGDQTISTTLPGEYRDLHYSIFTTLHIVVSVGRKSCMHISASQLLTVS